MSMPVRNAMNRPVVATTPSTPVRDVASQLVSGGISGMPVADRDGSVIGVITEYDIVNAILEGKRLEELRTADIMQKDVVSVDVDADVNEALKIFKEKHVIRVPVTQNGKLVGILSRTDALRGILDEPEFLVF
jgi:predicted transcriptional regulator